MCDNLPPGTWGDLMLAEEAAGRYEIAYDLANNKAETVFKPATPTVTPEDDDGNPLDGWRFRATDGCRAVQIVVREGERGSLFSYVGDTYTHRIGDLLNPKNDDPYCVDEGEALAEALHRSESTSMPLAVWDITSDTPVINLVIHQGRAYRHMELPERHSASSQP